MDEFDNARTILYQANAVQNGWTHISKNLYHKRLIWEQAKNDYKNMCGEKEEMMQNGEHPASLGEQNELIEYTRKLANNILRHLGKQKKSWISWRKSRARQ
jgi:hypothetical protein